MPWPRHVPPYLTDLTWPELLILRVRLGHVRRRALSAAWHARRPRQVLDMIRLLGDLADLTADIDRQLVVRQFPGWR
jgi:hypothetical protein